MNSKFVNLPKEKQNAIINAGFRVFSESSFKKAPMSEIAREADISKSLLFHYFRNKKEFFLFLYDYGMNLILERAREEVTLEDTDFFEIFIKSVKVKCKLLKEYPHLSRFTMRPLYEEDAEIQQALKDKLNEVTDASGFTILERIDRFRFKDEVDIEQLLNVVVNCGDGYMKNNISKLDTNVDEVERGYVEMLNFFKKSFYKPEYLK